MKSIIAALVIALFATYAFAEELTPEAKLWHARVFAGCTETSFGAGKYHSVKLENQEALATCAQTIPDDYPVSSTGIEAATLGRSYVKDGIVYLRP